MAAKKKKNWANKRLIYILFWLAHYITIVCTKQHKTVELSVVYRMFHLDIVDFEELLFIAISFTFSAYNSGGTKCKCNMTSDLIPQEYTYFSKYSEENKNDNMIMILGRRVFFNDLLCIKRYIYRINSYQDVVLIRKNYKMCSKFLLWINFSYNLLRFVLITCVLGILFLWNKIL